MKTTFEMRQPYAKTFLDCATAFPCNSPVRPVRFIRTMTQNRGSVSSLTGMGLDEDGLERKNPVIVGLGDSVTAGHFEALDDLNCPAEWINEILRRANTSPSDIDFEAFQHPDQREALLADLASKIPEGQGFPPIEITDSRRCYLEIFRQRLIDRYQQTSVSTINAGIAGDTLIMMERRLTRDVIRYQPDLTLINGSLNWNDVLGTTDDYKHILRSIVRRIKSETEADIVLMTPNGMVGDSHACDTLTERVMAIRETAVAEQVCLADAYAVWEMARDQGCPWREMLSNGINHPTVIGHIVYVEMLMKLFY